MGSDFLPFFFPNSLSLPPSHFYVPRTVSHPTRVPGSSMALRTQEDSTHLISSHPLLPSPLPHDPMHAAPLSLLMLCSSVSKCFQISCSFQPLSFCARCSLCLEYSLVDAYSSAGPSCNFLQEALQAVLPVHLRLPYQEPLWLHPFPCKPCTITVYCHCLFHCKVCDSGFEDLVVNKTHTISGSWNSFVELIFQGR